MTEVKYTKTHIAYKVAKNDEEKKNEKTRKLLILISHFLEKHGYMKAAMHLQSEISFNICQFSVCDNIDLEIILQEYEVFYDIKYGKAVQIYKRNDENEISEKEKSYKNARQRKSLALSLQSDYYKQKVTTTKTAEKDDKNAFQLLGPYSHLNVDHECRILAGIVTQDMLFERPNVLWNDGIGHDDAKDILKESLIYPIKYPRLYSMVKSWKGLLLYGPTGTGKTMLAKAAATECNSTFFNISIATLTSKWRGESEKILKVLFELARFHQPSIIFFDEVDSIMSNRTSIEHEASRRFKSELLSQMDGLTASCGNVFVLATSNAPWDLDLAFLRRMECCQYIAPPDFQGLMDLYMNYLPSSISYDIYTVHICVNYKALATVSEGITGADIFLISKRIKLEAIRKIVNILESNTATKPVNFAPVTLAEIMTSLHKVKRINLNVLKQYENFFRNDDL